MNPDRSLVRSIAAAKLEMVIVCMFAEGFYIVLILPLLTIKFSLTRPQIGDNGFGESLAFLRIGRGDMKETV